MVPDILNEKLEQSDDNEINDLYEKPRAHEINSNEISNYPALVKEGATSTQYFNAWTQRHISPRNYQRQKAIAAEIAFQVKIISGKNLLPSLFSLKYNNKKKL